MTTTLTEPVNGALAVRPADPMAIIQAALERGVDHDQLGKLLDLQERHERHRAAETFGDAVADFQRRCPPVHKGRKVASMGYVFASYDDVMAVAGPHLAACGIAVSFSTETTDRGVKVTVRVRVGIHAEDSTLEIPIPDMKVNSTQRYGAALSYAKRYALCAALNIVVTDEDDDAQLCNEVVTAEQVAALQAIIDAKQVDPVKFLAWIGAESLADIPASAYEKALAALRRKK